MFSRYRYPLFAVLSLTLLGAAPLAQAGHHVDFSLILPPLVVSSHHGHGPRVVAHFHGRQICHLRHEYRQGHGHDQYYDRHRHHHYDRHRHHRGHF